MAVSMTLSLTLDGVTYGELYEFVDAVRAAGVPADEAIRCLGSDDRGDRFEVELGPDRRPRGAGGSAAAVVAGTADTADTSEGGRSAGDPVRGGKGSAPEPMSVARVAQTVRSMVGDDEDLDRVIAALREMRRFLR